jgi:hypothetical protein
MFSVNFDIWLKLLLRKLKFSTSTEILDGINKIKKK